MLPEVLVDVKDDASVGGAVVVEHAAEGVQGALAVGVGPEAVAVQNAR